MSKGLVLPHSVVDVEAIEVVRTLAFANEIRLSSINLEGFKSGNQSPEK